MKLKYKAKLKRKTEPRPRNKREEVRPASRAARMLALAHYVEGLVESGRLTGYAEASRQLGITRARMSQVVNLVNLSPKVQEAILFGELRVSERRLRQFTGQPHWPVDVSAE